MYNFLLKVKHINKEEIMKKLVIVIVGVLLLFGCSCALMDTPTKKTEDYLNKYKNLDDDVLGDLDLSAEAENLNDENTETYKDLIKRQYQDMKYDVVNESIDGDQATVTVTLTVYDLYKTSQAADAYLTANPNEFTENNVYNNDLFMKYKLDKMNDTEDTIDYTVDFYLAKVDGDWVVQEPDETVKQKIHGLYDYED